MNICIKDIIYIYINIAAYATLDETVPQPCGPKQEPFVATASKT